MQRTRLWLVIAPVILMVAFSVSSYAQSYPRKPVTVIVPVAAGGNVDLVARGIFQMVGASLGQQFLVDNRPSNSSLVGTQLVARAAPDGYTLLAMASTFAVAPFVVRDAGYDPLKEFVAVSQTCWLPQILVVRPTLLVKSVQELIAYAKAHPGELTVAHSGTGGTGHMAWELFNQQVGGLKVVQVPYKGNAPALIDLLGGQVDVTFDTFSTSIQHVKAGKLRALGLTGTKRSPIFPDLPTIAESGLPGYEASIFNGIMAPAGTPRDILVRLQAEIAKAVQNPELRSKYSSQGVELTASESPEAFAAFIRNQVERYSKLVRDVGIKPE